MTYKRSTLTHNISRPGTGTGTEAQAQTQTPAMSPLLPHFGACMTCPACKACELWTLASTTCYTSTLDTFDVLILQEKRERRKAVNKGDVTMGPATRNGGHGHPYPEEIAAALTLVCCPASAIIMTIMWLSCL